MKIEHVIQMGDWVDSSSSVRIYARECYLNPQTVGLRFPIVKANVWKPKKVRKEVLKFRRPSSSDNSSDQDESDEDEAFDAPAR